MSTSRAAGQGRGKKDNTWGSCWIAVKCYKFWDTRLLVYCDIGREVQKNCRKIGYDTPVSSDSRTSCYLFCILHLDCNDAWLHRNAKLLFTICTEQPMFNIACHVMSCNVSPLSLLPDYSLIRSLCSTYTINGCTAASLRSLRSANESLWQKSFFADWLDNKKKELT